mmetsp:Transcript_30011/g.32696  ORF Transcript_30011/g.32696 Transcript_30011/m.32696 type:complete len:80 (-) Transcript_30011:582-821(-)
MRQETKEKNKKIHISLVSFHTAMFCRTPNNPLTSVKLYSNIQGICSSKFNIFLPLYSSFDTNNLFNNSKYSCTYDGSIL